MSMRPVVCTVIGTKRVAPDLVDPAEAVKSFAQPERTFTPAQAVEEAKRCTASSPCLYCDVCQLLCPDLAITRNDAGKIVIDLAFCKGCGLCAMYCPKGAIEMVVDE